MKIGYARASAPHQNLDRQLGAQRAELWTHLREKISGVTSRRARGCEGD